MMRPECIVITRFAPDQPGFLDFSYRIAALARHYRVVLVSAEPITQAELQFDGVLYVVLPQPPGRFGWLRYLWQCQRLINRLRPSCVMLLHSLVAPLALCTRIPTALYWNEHPSRFTASPPGHPRIKKWARKLIMRWFYIEAARRATVVMPIGEAHRDDLLAHGCHASRITLLHMGVHSAFATAHAIPARPDDGLIHLFYAGTVNEARGRDVLLEGLAMANRAHPIARLTLVGADAEQTAYCREAAARLGIAGLLDVCGRVAGGEMPALMAAADAGICAMADTPWWRFNPPTKLFEYLVAGLPVLASDICTHTAYVNHGINGLVFNYDSAGFSNAVRTLWLRRDELTQLKQRAAESGRQYLWDRIEPAFIQAMQRMSR